MVAASETLAMCFPVLRDQGWHMKRAPNCWQTEKGPMQEAALPFHRNSLTCSARYVVSTSLSLQPETHAAATPAIIKCCRVEWSVQLLQCACAWLLLIIDCWVMPSAAGMPSALAVVAGIDAGMLFVCMQCGVHRTTCSLVRTAKLLQP